MLEPSSRLVWINSHTTRARKSRYMPIKTELSSKLNRSSAAFNVIQTIAAMKKAKSLWIPHGGKSNGCINSTVPPITPITKAAEPSSSENINSVSASGLATAVNRSGDPLPNARIVTPANASLMLSVLAMAASVGQKLQEQKRYHTNVVDNSGWCNVLTTDQLSSLKQQSSKHKHKAGEQIPTETGSLVPSRWYSTESRRS